MQTTHETSHPHDPKFAVFNGSGEITDKMYQEVLAFVSFVNEKEAKERKNRPGTPTPQR